MDIVLRERMLLCCGTCESASLEVANEMIIYEEF